MVAKSTYLSLPQRRFSMKTGRIWMDPTALQDPKVTTTTTNRV